MNVFNAGAGEEQGFQVNGGLIPTPEKTRLTSDAKGARGPSVNRDLNWMSVSAITSLGFEPARDHIDGNGWRTNPPTLGCIDLPLVTRCHARNPGGVRALSSLEEELYYLEMLAKQLMLLAAEFGYFSKRALKSLNNQTDFDSATTENRQGERSRVGWTCGD